MSIRSRKVADDVKRLVLVVDDEQINRELLGFILSSTYDVLYAANGQEAMEQIHEHQSMLSLVLLDLKMPVMDGFAVLDRMREDQLLTKLPVIVLTSEKQAEVKSLRAGAVDFITKPYDLPEVILARVQRNIELAEDARIIQATEYDALTGLYSREYFHQYAAQLDQYHSGLRMDALALNINHFHLINELNGKQYGDQVLRQIADDIRNVLADVRGIACRTTADQFYIYCEHRDSYGDVMQRLLDGIADMLQSDRISLRLGVYPLVDKTVDVERRFDRSQLACNTIRGNYTQNIAYYDQDLYEREIFSEHLIEDIDEAIENRHLKVFFQPKYAIQGEKPVLQSAEALIRWIHPEIGMISPGLFVPLFEQNGLIRKLDRFVWREAAAQIADWRDRYGRTIPVSVNVSRIDIYDPTLSDEFLSIMEENRLQPSDYYLEITESAYTEETDQLISSVEKLRSLGFKVEMDDFGSGYSSLNTLSFLPVDVLKIDMGFVRDLEADPRKLRLLEIITEIAGYLAVPMIAEGVENRDQLEKLRELGCDIVQGFYFSRPVPPEEFERFITQEYSA